MLPTRTREKMEDQLEDNGDGRQHLLDVVGQLQVGHHRLAAPLHVGKPLPTHPHTPKNLRRAALTRV